jgi:hypothetical protein
VQPYEIETNRRMGIERPRAVKRKLANNERVCRGLCDTGSDEQRDECGK